MNEDVLEMLRLIRSEMEPFGDDLREIRNRLGRLQQETTSTLLRMDRIGDDLERIKHHLDAS